MARVDQADLVYRTEEAKFAAVVEDIAEHVEAGQPVLVGTVSVEKSEYLSDQLRKRGVKHEVLNAKQHDREATIVAQAGRKGAVTVATNMAGRGTDIMLGGNSEFMAAGPGAPGAESVENPEEYEAAWPQALAEAQEAVAKEHDEVTDAGGLYVLGTERHESRRIDNQLRGRSGRQGRPGETRFYLSLQDDLMRLFKGRHRRLVPAPVQRPRRRAHRSRHGDQAIANAQTSARRRTSRSARTSSSTTTCSTGSVW